MVHELLAKLHGELREGVNNNGSSFLFRAFLRLWEFGEAKKKQEWRSGCCNFQDRMTCLWQDSLFIPSTRRSSGQTTYTTGSNRLSVHHGSPEDFATFTYSVPSAVLRHLSLTLISRNLGIRSVSDARRFATEWSDFPLRNNCGQDIATILNPIWNNQEPEFYFHLSEMLGCDWACTIGMAANDNELIIGRRNGRPQVIRSLFRPDSKPSIKVLLAWWVRYLLCSHFSTGLVCRERAQAARDTHATQLMVQRIPTTSKSRFFFFFGF